jgi:hypothetical protein
MIKKYRQKKNADLGSAFETFVGSILKVKNTTNLMHFGVNQKLLTIYKHSK